MSPKILISICIPTYNQPHSVKRLLESIVAQIDPRVEIVVQDDSTNNETQKIVSEFSKKLPLRYFGRHVYTVQSVESLKKGEKGGIDRSIIFLTEEARGKYVWWLGDDIVANGALGRILKAVTAHPEIIFLWANHKPYGGDAPALSTEHDFFFRDRNEVLIRLVGGLGFISGTIFERDKALSGLAGAQKYIGTAFSNLYIVLYVLSHDGQYFCLKDPSVISFPNTPEEVNDNGFEVFGVNFFNIVMAFRGKFDRRAMRKMLSINFSHVWRGVLVRWATGYESPAGKRWTMLKLYWTYPEMWIALPLLFIPYPINKIFYRIYRIFFSDQRLRFLK